MNDKNQTVEENIHRMLQATLGGQAQPEKELRATMLNRLKDELPVKPISEFPVAVLGLLVLVLGFLSYWWLVQSGTTPSWQAGLIAALIGVNLLCIPIGSIVIVYRRRYV